MKMGLYGKLVGVIFTHCVFGIAITALMFRGYYAAIPNELIDASKIDGCGFWGIYRWVLLPIRSRPLLSCGIWQFTSHLERLSDRPDHREYPEAGAGERGSEEPSRHL